MTPIQALRALLGALPSNTGGTDAPDLPKALRDAQEALDAYDKGHGPVKAPEGPQPGETWQHFKGGLYQIITMVVDETTRSPMVVYTSPTGVWTRSLMEFLGPVSKDGYEGPRFVKVEDAPAPKTDMEELTKLRSFEMSVRDTISWGVDGPAEAERLNALMERDFTRDERNALIRVLCGLTFISVKPGDPCITQLVDGWKVGVQGGNMSAINGILSIALHQAGFTSDAEVVGKLVESR